MVASILLPLVLLQAPSTAGLDLLRHFAGQEVSKDKEGYKDILAYVAKSFNRRSQFWGFQNLGSPIYVLKSPLGFNVFQISESIYYNGGACGAFGSFNELGKPVNAIAFGAGPGMFVQT